MEFEGVPTVTLSDEAIVVAGKSYLYTDIRALSWRATITQTSFNGIPTGKKYESSLHFLDENKQRIFVRGINGFSGSLKRKSFEGISRIAEILAEITFTNRISVYENELALRNFFTYGQYQFHRSGDIFQGGVLAFNILKADAVQKSDPFTLTVTQPPKKNSFWSKINRKTITLPISIDRDCLLYLFNSVYGLSFTDENLRVKRVDRKALFYETAILLGALIAKADGVAEKSELHVLREYFEISSTEFPNASKLYNEQLRNPRKTHQILGEFCDEFYSDVELKEMLLFGMGRVAMADGFLHPSEVTILSQIAAELGIGENDANRILATLGINIDNNKRNSRGPASPKSETAQYAILGLKVGASRDEVKISYRKLVRRYHPDVLRSQNLPEDQLKSADKMMLEINAAYEWILSRY